MGDDHKPTDPRADSFFSKKKIWIIAGVASMILLASSIGIFALATNSDEDPEETQVAQDADQQTTEHDADNDEVEDPLTDDQDDSDDADTSEDTESDETSTNMPQSSTNPNIKDVSITILSRDEIRPNLEPYVPDFISDDFIEFLETHDLQQGGNDYMFASFQEDVDADGEIDSCVRGIKVTKISNINVFAERFNNFEACRLLGPGPYAFGLLPDSSWGSVTLDDGPGPNCTDFVGDLRIYTEFLVDRYCYSTEHAGATASPYGAHP